MFIVVQRSENSERVINVIHEQETSQVTSWMAQYLVDEMNSLSKCPELADTKYTSYIVEEIDGEMRLTKRYKQVVQGVFYNTHQRIQETVFVLKYMKYDGGNSGSCDSSLWQNINSEINRRALRQFDKDTLLHVEMQIQREMSRKKYWKACEYIRVVESVTKKISENFLWAQTSWMKNKLD